MAGLLPAAIFTPVSWPTSETSTVHRSSEPLAWNAITRPPVDSPAAAALSTGGRVIAFHASGSDDLWTVDVSDVGHDTGVKMAAGSSPAIAALPAGGYEVVFAG